MRRASFFERDRRVAALVLLSLLLHLAALVSIRGWLQRLAAPAPAQFDQSGALNARLELRNAPPLPLPIPPSPIAPQTVPAPVPVVSEQNSTATAPAATAVPPPLPAPTTPDPLAGASLVQQDGVPMRKPSNFRVHPPPSAAFAYDMTISSATGEAIGGGTSSLSWQLQDGRYTLRLASRYGAGSARDHTRQMTSSGGMDDMGIAPQSLEEQRDGGSAQRTSFERDTGEVRRPDAVRGDPIFNGSQDQASMLMQLAGIGSARAMRQGDEIVMHVSRAEAASMLVLTVIGEEQLDSPLGQLATWHLVQSGRGLELWLAPAYHWMPVQIRRTGPDGVVATELVREIAAPPRA